MNFILKVLGVAAIVVIMVSPFLFIKGTLSEETCKHILLGATAAWFVAAIGGLKLANKSAS